MVPGPSEAKTGPNRQICKMLNFVSLFFSLGRLRDHGETLLWTRFTPGALVQSSPDPNRTICLAIFGLWAGFSLRWPRGHGESLLWTRFTPGALVRRSAEPNRNSMVPFLGFGPLLKSRSPLKVDRIWGLPPIYFQGEVCPLTGSQTVPGPAPGPVHTSP